VSFFYWVICYFIHSFLEQNQRVFVYEDNEWMIKGRYETALGDADDDVMWTHEDGQELLRFLIVSILLQFSLPENNSVI